MTRETTLGRTAAGGTTATAGEVLSGYLHGQATDFLRSLRVYTDNGADAEDAWEAGHALRRAARRITGTLYVYRPLTDPAWTDPLRAELTWLSELLGREHAYAARLARLRGALHRLSGATGPEMGAARAGALLDRQLTLARTRAHTAALRAVGSDRFHAAVDAVAVLASEVPLDAETRDLPAGQALARLAEETQRQLLDAVEALPLAVAGRAYNAEGLTQGDTPWHEVRRLVRLRRYAQEVLDEQAAVACGTPSAAVRLLGAGQALDRHRDAAEAAAAAAAAACTPRIAAATAYALGVLHADQRQEVEAARYTFGRIWQRLVGAEVGVG
ncbi:CHAD domain-containing protein [Streptomyces mashuensis]|uniref:CHAD domain-containing protein n=1 Tax=Streptomyces mashuensis TaxID=33904 RepID=A0A919B499_9ACTN|nr:CHAD domain-containing protein [Streptomyces mashuensis]GHF46150.1 CHAD domain-containing protein [Streptomyces mashuensis]